MTLPTPAIYNRSELVKFGLENAPCKLCFIDALDDNDLFFSYGQWLNEKLQHTKTCRNRKKHTLYQLITKRVEIEQ